MLFMESQLQHLALTTEIPHIPVEEVAISLIKLINGPAVSPSLDLDR